MYSIQDLLSLANVEKAELKIRVGQSPVIVVKGEQQMVEGPKVTAEEAEEFLLSIANSRLRRVLREKKRLQFFHEHRGQRFLVFIKLAGENIEFDIK